MCVILTCYLFSNFRLASELLCCDAEMVQTMETNLLMASGIFGRCETCMKNLRKSICDFTCSPKHSRYLTPKIAEIQVENETGIFF